MQKKQKLQFRNPIYEKCSFEIAATWQLASKVIIKMIGTSFYWKIKGHSLTLT